MQTKNLSNDIKDVLIIMLNNKKFFNSLERIYYQSIISTVTFELFSSQHLQVKENDNMLLQDKEKCYGKLQIISLRCCLLTNLRATKLSTFLEQRLSKPPISV